MDTRQLRYFTAVCEFRNLSHAADHCNTAASALSLHIARLEEELDTKLFTRKPRGMDPTAAGLKLLEHAKYILAAFETAASDVRLGHAEIAGNIAIGMPYSVINVIGAGLMRTVMEDLPKVRLLIREGLSGMTYTALRTGEVEAALIFNPAPDGQTQRVPLIEEELFCIGRREIIGDPSQPIRLEDMAALPLALLQSGSLSRALVDRPAELARLEANARIQLASIAGTLNAMKAGLACTLAPKVLVSDELRTGELVARPVIDPTPIRTLYLVSAADERPTFLRERISALICDLVQQAVQEGRWEGARLSG
ncbi:LysR family transcriptional regulator [Pseudoprimorskyibacter insulae]|uniref:HTH-type transcriptional regulator GltC n=1 Tax=Pseudoprimorskyibacter insulae TaxID=1695997 RepID=A0A2R8B0B7_9RHOB|nr:LysR family transcriptional regulator [Pseudoprimorskyibacter insulae]SPF81735.1 HTH-type transcriptional regulator GltC [Pseudoprimorskyibacter insulae]